MQIVRLVMMIAAVAGVIYALEYMDCLLYTSPSPRD